MTNEILTSVDLMTLACEVDDANEAYRAALIREGKAERELTTARAEVDATSTAVNQANKALCAAATTNPVTMEFWDNPK